MRMVRMELQWIRTFIDTFVYLDRGFVFAIAHIRGGEDLGRQWYEDGKLLKRKILYGFHRLLKVN
jgi:protease II